MFPLLSLPKPNFVYTCFEDYIASGNCHLCEFNMLVRDGQCYVCAEQLRSITGDILNVQGSAGQGSRGQVART